MRAVAAVILGAIGMAMTTGCATFSAGAPEGEIAVIAHRGASTYAPENTLAAFERAIDLGADWFELDCTLSRDNRVVVIHDDDVERTTGFTEVVRDSDYEAIRDYDAGSWFSNAFADQRIPLLEDALTLAKDRIGIYIEIKDSDDDSELLATLLALGNEYERFYPEYERLVMRHVKESGTRNYLLTRLVVQQVREHDMQQQVVIQSFSPVVCAVAQSLAPEMRVELLGTSSDRDPELWARYQEWVRLMNPAGFNVNKDDVDPELVTRLHDDGRTIAVWTVNDEADMEHLRDMRVDAIITDRPDIALEVLGRARD